MNWRLIAFLFLAVVFAGLQLKDGSDTYNAQVDGCERTNEGLRQPLYEFFTGAIAVRRAEAQASHRLVRKKAAQEAARAGGDGH